MREVDIIYLYEHSSRELDVACALAAILERDFGLSVELVQWPVGMGRVIHNLRPGKMVIFPFCYSEREYIVLMAYWRGVQYFNLAWEQIFYQGNEKAKTPRGDFALKDVYHHSWSDKYVDFLKASGISSDHIFLNGQPAYTLYDEPYCRYFKTRSILATEYSLDPSKRWIFFPENYIWAFYSEARLKMYIRDGQSAADVYAMRKYCNTSLEKVLQWFTRLIKDNGNIELIIRPRPSTTVADFQSAIGQYLDGCPDQIHIIQDDSVREWIRASDVTVSSHSTSLIEASVTGKKAFMLEPYPIPDALKAEWHGLLPHLKTFDDLLAALTGENKVLPDTRLNDWARRYLMDKGDSIKNLAGYLSGLSRTPVAPAVSSILIIKPRYPPAFVWVIYRNLRRWYFYWRTMGVEPHYVKDLVPRSEIAARKKKWLSLLG
jgi:surface carbohydrate biosynthesis protein